MTQFISYLPDTVVSMIYIRYTYVSGVVVALNEMHSSAVLSLLVFFLSRS